MHQIILLTALSATTGLFGGGRQCSGGGCGMPMMYQPAYAAPYGGGCQGGMGCGMPYAYPQGAVYAAPQGGVYAAPQAAPQAAPAPASKAAPAAAPAPPAPAPGALMVPQAGFYPAQVFTSAPTWVGGPFYRR